jgi:uncharacterized delta-60 repeat protein
MKLSALAFAVCSLGPTLAPAAPGDVEPGFNPGVDISGVDGVHTFSILPDGRIIIGGSFKTLGGIAYENIARLNAGGTVDASFHPQVDHAVQVSALQHDGKILLGGEFNTVEGVTRARLARLHADGALDTDFVASASGEVRVVQPLTDGDILVGGTFTSVNGSGRSYLAKVTSTGALVSGFNPAINARVRTAAVQLDGKILIGGDFTNVNGSTRNRLARLNADGSLDTGFNPNVSGNGVYAIAVQGNGAIVFGGSFTSVGGTSRRNIARLSTAGALDAGFNPMSDDLVRCVVVQTDGRLILTGNFSAIAGASRSRIARLTASGVADTAFTSGANDIVFGAAIQADGKVLVGGEFTEIGPASLIYLARLENDPAAQSLTIPSPSRIQWLRGGSSPETHEVTFETSTDGGSSWNPAGRGTRMAGGWELTGAALPASASGQVRARARVFGTYGGACSSLVETLASYSFTALQMWRQTNFGTLDSNGNAADNADPDKDGLENLVEYAFALNPNTPDAAALPAWEKDENDYVLTFTRPANASGITYVAEYSDSLNPGSWTAAANAGTGDNYVFYTTATGPRLYLRARVTAP